MAAVLLNQPWGLSTIAELHRHALLIAFNMLDTISWDILYVCDERLDAVWRFIARYSDALFYDSQFTRDRFAIRFPLQAHVAERVTHLSLAKDEQVDRDVLGEPAGDHILLFGNDYDHKDVRRTLQLLVDALSITPRSSLLALMAAVSAKRGHHAERHDRTHRVAPAHCRCSGHRLSFLLRRFRHAGCPGSGVRADSRCPAIAAVVGNFGTTADAGSVGAVRHDCVAW